MNKNKLRFLTIFCVIVGPFIGIASMRISQKAFSTRFQDIVFLNLGFFVITEDHALAFSMWVVMSICAFIVVYSTRHIIHWERINNLTRSMNVVGLVLAAFLYLHLALLSLGQTKQIASQERSNVNLAEINQNPLITSLDKQISFNETAYRQACTKDSMLMAQINGDRAGMQTLQSANQHVNAGIMNKTIHEKTAILKESQNVTARWLVSLQNLTTKRARLNDSLFALCEKEQKQFDAPIANFIEISQLIIGMFAGMLGWALGSFTQIQPLELDAKNYRATKRTQQTRKNPSQKSQMKPQTIQFVNDDSEIDETFQEFNHRAGKAWIQWRVLTEKYSSGDQAYCRKRCGFGEGKKSTVSQWVGQAKRFKKEHPDRTISKALELYGVWSSMQSSTKAHQNGKNGTSPQGLFTSDD